MFPENEKDRQRHEHDGLLDEAGRREREAGLQRAGRLGPRSDALDREQQPQQIEGVLSREIEPCPRGLVARGEGPGGHRPGQRAVGLARCDPVQERQTGERRDHTHPAQRSEPLASDRRHGGGHVVVEGRVHVRDELERRPGEDRATLEHAPRVCEHPAFHPLELVGISEAKGEQREQQQPEPGEHRKQDPLERTINAHSRAPEAPWSARA